MSDHESIVREALGGRQLLGPLRNEEAHAALDALVAERDNAEKTIAVLLAVLPRMIVEAATDFHTSYMDGRQPELSEAGLSARLDRIVREKFPDRSES